MPMIPEHPAPPDSGHSAGLLSQAKTSTAAGTGEAPSASSTAQQQPVAAPAAASAPANASTGQRRRLRESGSLTRFVADKRSHSNADARPIKGRTRFMLQLGIMLLFLVVFWLIAGKGRGQPYASPIGAAPGNGQGASGATNLPATTPVLTQGSATAGPQQTATHGKTEPLTPEQVTATFLLAYFTWDETENDQAYVQSWSQDVPSTAIAALDSASPRLWLDNGNDSAAKSSVPPISEASVQIHQGSAQIQTNWPIQIVPKATESAAWQTKQIQATVWLAQSGTTWLVTNLTWQSSGS